jgi:pyruvate dehydrogenase E2 component (dihydrolipoamide acetyltransferase)
MAEFIVMPKMGFDMREGEFNGWVKNIGDVVNRGDVVAEIESDKATLELETQVSGVLLATLVKPGDIVAVGENVGIVGEAGEDISGLMGGAAAPAKAAAKPEPEPEAQAEAAPAPVSGGQTAEANPDFPGGIKATPVARRLAADKGVNLLQVNYEGDRIRKADVEAFLTAPAPAATPVAPAPVSAPAPKPAPAPQVVAEVAVDGGDSTAVATTKLRQAIARRMVESKTTVPHFQVTIEIDMAPVLALREQLNQMLSDDGVKISVNDILVKAAGVALTSFPSLNASFGGDKIIYHNRINVGSAVATPNGLLTVVQKDTDKSTLSQVAKDNRAMIVRARDGKISPDDVTGSTFTLSNLGVYGVDSFTAIINPPEAAILAIGGVITKPVVVDGEIKIGQRMKVTISADHRVTDGAEAAEFLVRYKALLENPMRLLV